MIKELNCIMGQVVDVWYIRLYCNSKYDVFTHCLLVLQNFSTGHFVHRLGNQVVYLYSLLCLRGHGGLNDMMISLSSTIQLPTPSSINALISC